MADIRRRNLQLLVDKYESQQEVADIVKISPQYLSQLLSGHRNIGEKTARKIEAAVKIPRLTLEIGRHHQIVELRSGEPTLVPCAEVDAAVALVSDSKHVSSWQGDDGDGYDTPSSVGQAVAGLRVKKFGRTTGLTHGTIESLVPHRTPLPYKTKNFSAVVWFQNVWTILGDRNEPFALPGDSGSLVVTEDGKESVGLIFAVSRQYGLIVSIQEALSQLGGLSLVSNHGIRA